ncbi:hypothetical protein TWF481_007214 [Arthrobotrys musiformis]|uniref:CMP/dCMP-type deaminase domain-containing protein n=1 Tax=Arthrobotrys musiformis TaxID=47236 RepID=A0AAV9WCF8_9PEZI
MNYKPQDGATMHAMQPEAPHETPSPHRHFMELALEEARKCIPSQTAFSVGAVLVDSTTSPYRIVATGFSRELEGNTHAEEVCFKKVAVGSSPPGSGTDYTLYTTMEPCSERLSGKKPCVDRILEFGRISTVYIGCREPSTFIQENTAVQRLLERGIRYLPVEGMSCECQEVATRGHN